MDRIPKTLMVLALAAAGATTLQAQKPSRPTPVLVGTPAAARPGAAATDTGGTKRARATPTLVGAPAAGRAAAPSDSGMVEPQAARPAAPSPVAAFTAGLAVEPYDGSEALEAYGLRFARRLDSAIVTLVDVFRNTSGQPLSGAAAPTALSQRERDRWNRCRDLHWDLLSFTVAAHDLPEAFGEAPTLLQAAAGLDSALTAVVATGECDNVASMVVAPERWTPWGEQYQASARRFYTQWYPQVRAVQERNRAFIVALNGVAEPGDRVSVPPTMPRNPPYAGAGVR